MPAAALAPELRPAGAAGPQHEHLCLADALDRLLHRGVALHGNLTIGLAEVELLYLDVRVLLGSVDTIWPDGHPTLPALRPRTLSSPSSPPSEQAPGAPSDPRFADGAPPAAAVGRPTLPRGERSESGSSTARGLVQLVLTLVKLLHEVLERQAVRRMEAGRLSDAEIENVGAALFAQAEEIAHLQRRFGFSDKELSLDLGAPQGAL